MSILDHNCKIHVKFHVIKQGFSNMASGCLVAGLPANQMPGLKIFFNMEISQAKNIKQCCTRQKYRKRRVLNRFNYMLQ